jgi:nitroimidazol reductase NimA-like FMN-containing flavoprotein (pyridoxamine 5'-phosphate oxidase superfamily)
MDPEEVEQLLIEAQVGRVGTVDREGVPYVVPLNYVYDAPSRTVFLHCAASGHLLDNLTFSPLACFEVDEPGEIIATGPDGCSTSQVYRSVIAFGRASAVHGREEKEQALRLLVRKYVDGFMPARRYDPALPTIESTTVIAFRLEQVTGKRRQAE